MGISFGTYIVNDVLQNALEKARDSIVRLRDVLMEDTLDHLPENVLPDDHPFIQHQERKQYYIKNHEHNFVP